MNEGCGIDPLVVASGNKEEFSGKNKLFQLSLLFADISSGISSLP